MTFLIPLSLIKQLHKLSFLSIFGDFVIFISIIYYLFVFFFIIGYYK